ncbi:MAG: hypothetical protein AAGK97_03140 [Bacteroidota bacterium]
MQIKNLTISLTAGICLFLNLSLLSQHSVKEISDAEKVMLQNIFNDINESDQRYRLPLSAGTLDKDFLEKLEVLSKEGDIEKYMAFRNSLKEKMSEEVKDSLWNLQHNLDLKNHLTIKGIWDIYGFIPEDIIEENNHVQILLLMHPPKDWDVEGYLSSYSSILLEEVKADRMPAKQYAQFVDNINAKILRRPQIYGTNNQFDVKTNSVLPPGIKNLEESNAARLEIGLPLLQDGEYRIVSIN